MDQAVIGPARCQIFRLEIVAVFHAVAVGLPQRDVAGGIFIIERVVKQQAAGGNWRGMRHQRNFPEAAGALVGIGGVLEPVQANPTIIEDNCFIGARSEIVEGVIVEEGSVISMGVFIGQSTKIYDRETGEIHYGRVPAGSVVVSGSLPSKDGSYSLYCAVIVKKVDEKTRGKVGINELLRGI